MRSCRFNQSTQVWQSIVSESVSLVMTTVVAALALAKAQGRLDTMPVRARVKVNMRLRPPLPPFIPPPVPQMQMEVHVCIHRLYFIHVVESSLACCRIAGSLLKCEQQ